MESGPPRRASTLCRLGHSCEANIASRNDAKSALAVRFGPVEERRKAEARIMLRPNVGLVGPHAARSETVVSLRPGFCPRAQLPYERGSAGSILECMLLYFYLPEGKVYRSITTHGRHPRIKSRLQTNIR